MANPQCETLLTLGVAMRKFEAVMSNGSADGDRHYYRPSFVSKSLAVVLPKTLGLSILFSTR